MLILPFAGRMGGGPIQFVNASKQAGASSTINLPSGMIPGDLVIVASVYDSSNTPAYASGYTSGQSGNPSTSLGVMWCYKFMPSPVDTQATVLTSNSACGHLAMAFRNVHSSSPLDVASPTLGNGGTLDPDPPSVVSSNPGAIVIIGYLDDDIATSVSAPTDWTMDANCWGTTGVSGTGGSIMGAYRITTAGGTYNAGAFTTSGDDQWNAATIALRRA